MTNMLKRFTLPDAVAATLMRVNDYRRLEPDMNAILNAQRDHVVREMVKLIMERGDIAHEKAMAIKYVSGPVEVGILQLGIEREFRMLAAELASLLPKES